MKAKHQKYMKTYLTVDELQTIKNAANSVNLSTSRYVRQICLGYKVTSKIEYESLLMLIKLRNDFNRLGNLFKQYIYKNPQDYKDAQKLYKSIFTTKNDLDAEIKNITKKFLLNN